MAVDFIIGRKVGMTRIFDDVGLDYPVTIVEAGPCDVTQINSVDKEGYASVQIGFLAKSKQLFKKKNSKKELRFKKSEKGHCDKAGVSVKKILKEFQICLQRD